MSIAIWVFGVWAVVSAVSILVLCYCKPSRDEVQGRIDFLKEEIKRLEKRGWENRDKLWALAEVIGYEFETQPEKLIAIKKARKR